MTKNEYISALGRELKRLGVADAGDVVEEYEQHFAFKSADGCSEEETAARLGDPAVLAAQFAGAGGKESSGALAARRDTGERGAVSCGYLRRSFSCCWPPGRW